MLPRQLEMVSLLLIYLFSDLMVFEDQRNDRLARLTALPIPRLQAPWQLIGMFPVKGADKCVSFTDPMVQDKLVSDVTLEY